MAKQILIKMKKILLLLFIPVMCFSKEKKKDINIELSNIRDSLLRSHIDTIIIYKKSCIGCFVGTQSNAYIYTRNNNNTILFRINERGTNLIRVYDNKLFNYYLINEFELKNEKINYKWSMDHYKYIEVETFIGSSHYHNEIPLFLLECNDSTFFVNFIYRIDFTIHSDLEDW